MFRLSRIVQRQQPSVAYHCHKLHSKWVYPSMRIPKATVLIRQQYSTDDRPSFGVVDYGDIQCIIKSGNKDYQLIDVREETELMQGRIPTAKNVPLSQFGQAWSLSPEDFQVSFGFPKPDHDAPLIVYCQAGIRSAKAADYLSQLGYQNIRNYRGSWADYINRTNQSKQSTMGICTSSEERAGRNKSQSIDRMIEKDGQKLKRECKILLLGSGESGKSTIVKQMKILHQGGYTKQELFAWRPTVYKNLMESVLALISAIQKYEYQYEDDKNNYYANYIVNYQLSEHNHPALDSNLIDAISNLWKDGVIIQLLNKEGGEFYLMDSAPYFFEHVKRIGHPDYIPNVQDVLRARSKTTGIIESHFNLGQLHIHMFDVGGQRSERKKWIHCFEAVTSIIFCVSLSEYDQVLLEESRQNRMMESLVLFESVINSRWFLRTSIILFLNKIDIFKTKLPKVPLERYFPDYGGGSDISKAAKYILWRFSQTNRAKLRIYPHLTEATDTANINIVFAAIKRTILSNALKDSGIL